MMNTDAYKKDVRVWSRAQLAVFKRNIRMLTNQEKHLLIKAVNVKGIRRGRSSSLAPRHLIDSLSAKVRTRYDAPERVVFPFVKHGFFIAVGASKGHPHKTNPRRKIDWYDTALDTGIEKLADIVVKHEADDAVKRVADMVVRK